MTRRTMRRRSTSYTRPTMPIASAPSCRTSSTITGLLSPEPFPEATQAGRSPRSAPPPGNEDIGMNGLLMLLSFGTTALAGLWLWLQDREIRRLRDEAHGLLAELVGAESSRNHFKREYAWWRGHAENLSAMLRDQTGYAERLPDARGPDV